jgi:predicted O-linked N-acetylglucosamine transferase (SPINDLY family)
MTPSQAVQQATLAYSRGDLAAAKQLCAYALNAEPGHFSALSLLGVLAARMGHAEAAAEFLGRAVAARPREAAAHNNYGIALKNLHRFGEALACYARALSLDPGFSEAHYNQGVVLELLGRPDEALASYERALALNPKYADAHNNRGKALNSLGRTSEALASFDRAIAIQPALLEAHNNRGAILRSLGRLDEALASYEQALRLNPNDAAAYNHRGVVRQKLGRTDEALHDYERALRLKPDYAEVHSNRGVLLQQLGRFDEALASIDSALRLQPNYADAHFNRGNVLVELKRFELACASYERALAIAPAVPEVLHNYGHVLFEMLRFEDALRSYDQALAALPGYAEAWYSRGNVLKELQRTEDALASYARALELQPDYAWLYGSWLHTKMQLCDWSDFEARISELAARIERRETATPPFPVLSLMDSPSLHQLAARTWIEKEHPRASAPLPMAAGPRHERIRVGYFSRDFRNHSVAMLLAETLERHDRSRFEISAFSYGPDTQDQMRRRIELGVDRFVDVQWRRDEDVVRLARDMELDIAVDLVGFTGGRLGVFALRAAPVQVSYLGYLGTLGADFMDYLIADETIVPAEKRRHYTERIAYLPSYQANDSKLAIADKHCTRAELGLAETGFVFCCFNASYKITPPTFDRWMRILRAIEGSQMLLLGDVARVEQHLRREAERRGVDGKRLVFGQKLPVPEYLARFRCADLFLDTLPYNAGTTASNALWAGLPVLTQIGESFPARVAASLLHAVGMPELVTYTSDEYEAAAIGLGTHPSHLAALREKLARNRLTTPLFDTGSFTRHLEEAYRLMHARRMAGLDPDHIFAAG